MNNFLRPIFDLKNKRPFVRQNVFEMTNLTLFQELTI